MRIAVVNHLIPERICRILQSVPGYEVVWVAQDGDDAIKRCAIDRPDLLLLDPDIPGLDGVEAARQIMENNPCPILIVTTTIDNNAARVFKTIGFGALDAVNAPLSGNNEQAEHSRKIFLKKVNAIIHLHPHKNPLLPTDAPPSRKPPRSTTSKFESKTIHTEAAIQRRTETFRHKTETFRAYGITLPPLVVIGASTGGPKTLVKVFAHLPKSLNAAIIIVQHLDQEFSAGLAEWLNTHTALHVRVARRGMHPGKGVVDVAGTNDHLVLTSALTYAYTPEPFENPYRPSVDVFFQSTARYWSDPGCAILLTGMGRDGAVELLTLRRLGWHTIAQDQATSIVYGMPKAAKEINAAIEILPLDYIGTAIQRFAEQRSRLIVT